MSTERQDFRRFSMRALPGRCLCIALLLLVASCGTAELYAGLQEKEANEFIVRLAAAGIPAEKEKKGEEGKETYTVVVAKDKLEAAFNVLNLYGLPKDKGHGIAQVYAGGGLVPGQYEEKAKYILALTGEIEMTLRAVERVVDARVHVVIPAESVLKDEDEGTVRPTASVLIKYIPTSDKKKPIDDSDVKQLVARAIEGLNVNDVTVVMVEASAPAGMPAAEGKPGSPAPGGFTLDECLDKFKDNLVDKAVVVKVGPILVHKDSYKIFMAVVGGLAGLSLILLVLWLVSSLQVSSLRKKLAAATKGAKAKKPNSTP